MTRGREQLRNGASERLPSAKLLCQAHPQPEVFRFLSNSGDVPRRPSGTLPRATLLLPGEWGRPSPSFLPSGLLSPPLPPPGLLASVHQHRAQPPTPPQTPPTALPLSPGFHLVLPQPHLLLPCLPPSPPRGVDHTCLPALLAHVRFSPPVASAPLGVYFPGAVGRALGQPRSVPAGGHC